VQDASPAAELARSPAAWERLAKDWIVEIIERTPLDAVDQLPLGWMSQEAPPLIAEILGQLSDPGPASELRLPPSARERAVSLAAARPPSSPPGSLPRELATLQALLVDALDRELPRRERSEFARAVARLAEVFGALAAAAMESSPETNVRAEPLAPSIPAGQAGLGPSLERALEVADAAAQPLAVAWFEIEGVERITKGYGATAATRIVEAVSGVVAGQLDRSQSAYQIGEGSIVVLAPGLEAIDFARVAVEIAEVVAGSQSESGPRIDVTVGIASYPLHGDAAETLLADAEEAAWSARAAGDQVAVAEASGLPDQ
jgi:GGDEF domain-containing protein